MDENRINSAISAWFEPKPTEPLTVETGGKQSGVGVMGYSPLKLWWYNGDTNEWHPHDRPDYYHSEDANARLLEAMPEPQLWIESDKGEPKLWGCSADLQDERSGYFTAFDEDRKTAVVLAFCKFAGIEI